MDDFTGAVDLSEGEQEVEFDPETLAALQGQQQQGPQWIGTRDGGAVRAAAIVALEIQARGKGRWVIVALTVNGPSQELLADKPWTTRLEAEKALCNLLRYL